MTDHRITASCNACGTEIEVEKDEVGLMFISDFNERHREHNE